MKRPPAYCDRHLPRGVISPLAIEGGAALQVQAQGLGRRQAQSLGGHPALRDHRCAELALPGLGHEGQGAARPAGLALCQRLCADV